MPLQQDKGGSREAEEALLGPEGTGDSTQRRRQQRQRGMGHTVANLQLLKVEAKLKLKLRCSWWVSPEVSEEGAEQAI